MCGGQKTLRSQAFPSRGPGVESGATALHGFYIEPSSQSGSSFDACPQQVTGRSCLEDWAFEGCCLACSSRTLSVCLSSPEEPLPSTLLSQLWWTATLWNPEPKINTSSLGCFFVLVGSRDRHKDNTQGFLHSTYKKYAFMLYYWSSVFTCYIKIPLSVSSPPSPSFFEIWLHAAKVNLELLILPLLLPKC